MFASNAQELQDELVNCGIIIKKHEDNLTFLKAQRKQLHDSILDMQVRLGKYHTSSTISTENDELSSARTDNETMDRFEKETVDQIMKHSNSAAGILCQMQVHKCLWRSSLSLIKKDVIGIVATLGRVDDENLSRMLSEYLGLDTMLAIVCKSYSGVKSLEAYDKEGGVNEDSGMHFLGSDQGKTLNGRFEVICLENLRSYAGGFVAKDPQKRLDITNPSDPNGETLVGFVGFAVNLIKVDTDHLSCLTSTGCGIRETLFYNLFSRLQIYKTRSDMLNALPFITDGAISLDDGMIKSNGRFFLGRREDVDVTFPKAMDVPLGTIEAKNQVKQYEWEKERFEEDTWREQSMLDQAKHKFQQMEHELVKILSERARQCFSEEAHSEGVHPEVVEAHTPLPDVQDVDLRNSPLSEPIDYSPDFKTNQAWPDRDSLLAWAREVALKRNMVLTIERSWASRKTRWGKIHLTCERYGIHRNKKKQESYKDGKQRRMKRSKKSGCTFSLFGYEAERNEWRLEVECGFHNHDLPKSLEGHAFVGRMTEKEYLMAKELLASRKKPQSILCEIKSKSPTNLTSKQQLYNTLCKLKKEAVKEQNTTTATFDTCS